ncbi:MAG: dihydrofolate reductase family protein [Pseudonocardiales bacterium]|nr:dihydrofolate reductase family protein [Pseudonocardiales bacterium]
MIVRPYVILSCVMSLDGLIDDVSDERLLLSNEADFDRVDELRASCDAILIGANTVRRDNPCLIVKSDARRQAREARGLSPYPVKVTITGTIFDPDLRFFNSGGEKLVYSPGVAVERVQASVGDRATVVGAGDKTVNFVAMLHNLADRGVRRLMVEGGGTIHTQFLTQGLADELHLAIAPFFVGQRAAPRFVNPGVFPQDAQHRMVIKEVRQIGDIVFVRYRVAGHGDDA